MNAERKPILDCCQSAFQRSLRSLQENRARFFLFFFIAILGNFLTAIILRGFTDLYFHRGPSAVHIQWYDLAPLGAVPILYFSLIFEAAILGWDNSSFARLLESKEKTIKTDIFYLLIYFSGISIFFAEFFSLGAGFYLQQFIREKLRWGLLSGASFGLSFAIQFFMGSLIFYLFHRLQHTRYFWEYHKVHHAASQMTLANNFRNHPLMIGMKLVFESVPGAILGISPSVLLLYAAIAGSISLWQHTNLNWNLPWIEKYILIGAADHRVHHSRRLEHFNSNFGYLVFWDWLFGSHYQSSKEETILIGLHDPLHNQGRPFREMLNVYQSGAKKFCAEMIRLLSFVSAPQRDAFLDR